MLVVKRSFRNFGEMMLPGSVVEPGSIKRFKGRIKDGFLVEVTEQDFDKWNAYFITKFQTPIGPLHDKTDDRLDGTSEVNVEPVAKPVTTEAAKPAVTIKPVAAVKVASK